MSKGSHLLQKEVSGLVFTNPVGMPYTIKKRRFSLFHCVPKAGFLTLTPPKEQILSWIQSLEQEKTGGCLLAVNIRTDIVRTFSLVYDFPAFIIIDPDSDNGIGASDISDTQVLLDELVSLRLCYERYTPFFLRLSHGLTEEELAYLLGSCQLAGIDGVVVPTPQMVARVREITLGRLPIIGMAGNQEEALQALDNGASLVEVATSSIGLKKLVKTLEKRQ